jgi:hypothetical protein
MHAHWEVVCEMLFPFLLSSLDVQR